jgi:hypothetical protein
MAKKKSKPVARKPKPVSKKEAPKAAPTAKADQGAVETGSIVLADQSAIIRKVTREWNSKGHEWTAKFGLPKAENDGQVVLIARLRYGLISITEL